MTIQTAQTTTHNNHEAHGWKMSESLRIFRFLSVLFAALAPALAHLLELPNKIHLSRENYLTVQQIYRGWAYLGFVVFGALVSTLVLTIMGRHEPRSFVPALIAFLCIVGTQVLFWTFTDPANQATQNWTTLPDDWISLRNQWEYSHAANAGFNLIGFIAVIVSVLSGRDRG